MRGVLLFGLLAACETADSSPAPIEPVPPPPVPADAAPIAVDAMQPVERPRCYYNGPKEMIRLESEHPSVGGRLFRVTTGPVPDRAIFYTVTPEGSGSFALIFDRYDKGDYQRMWNARPTVPREKLVAGKSVIARVFLQGDKWFIVGVDVDLATGMRNQFPGRAYPCQPPW